MSGMIRVEVAYALANEQVIVALDVADGTTAAEAVRCSGLLTRFPQIDLARAKLGVFGKHCAPEYRLRARDRVEIYRPLTADPKTARRRRAAG